MSQQNPRGNRGGRGGGGGGGYHGGQQQRPAGQGGNNYDRQQQGGRPQQQQYGNDRNQRRDQGGDGGGYQQRGGGGGGRGGGGGGGYQQRGGGGGGRGDGGGYQQRGGGQRGFGGAPPRGGGRGFTRIDFQLRQNLPPFQGEKDTRNYPVPKSKWNPDFNKDGDNKLPQRKDKVGAAGKPVKITVNHFLMNIKPPKSMYQYRVDVERVRNTGGDQPKSETPSSSSDGGKKKKGKKPGGGVGGGGDIPPAESSVQPRPLPAELMKRIMIDVLKAMHNEAAASLKEGLIKSKVGIASDFSHYIYATNGKLDDCGIPTVRDIVGVTGLPEEAGSRFRVRITGPTGQVDIANLQIDLNNLSSSMDNYLADIRELEFLERAYSTVMRCVNLNTFDPVRRTSLVDYTRKPYSLGGGVVSYSGYNVLFPLTNGWKPFLNIEIANLATYLEGPEEVSAEDQHADGYTGVLRVIWDAFKNTKNPRYSTPPENVKIWKGGQLAQINDLLKTCKVSYKQGVGKVFTKTVDRVCRNSVSEEKFKLNGKDTSVYDYFKSVLRIPLKYPNGPCLECRGEKKPKIPAEVCTLKRGQSYNRKLNDTQTAKMVDAARKDPVDLQPAIQEAIGKLKLQNNSVLESFGVELLNGGKMHEVDARVISPPELCYGKGQGPNATKNAVVTPDKGQWDIWNYRDGKNFQFYRNAKIVTWGILNLAIASRDSVNRATCLSFANDLIGKARMRELEIPPLQNAMYQEFDLPNDAVSQKKNVDTLVPVLKKFQAAFFPEKNSHEGCFLLVVVPEKGCQLYNHVKQAAELHVGILTQCITAKSMTATGGKYQSVLGNILLKINSKLTHVNHVVLPPPNVDAKFTIFNYPTMIIGADVTHPPPGTTTYQKDESGNEVAVGPPSFAAVTASIDRTGMPFMMHVQAQRKAGKGAAEVIENLDFIVTKFLKEFYRRTRAIPVKIIYFRDGVGDGQFQEVLRKEMFAIRAGCNRMPNDYQPGITFITVQKRHKTRFFLGNGNNQFDNAGPGTVVDTDIVHPFENDFYLLSHQAILGTSRPTRYHVLWDDSDFSLAEIQTMAYFLCYMFVRCNRSVKIPAPTYYAHWAAKRAEILSKGWIDPLNARIDGVRLINAELEKRETQSNFGRIYPMHFV